MISVRSRDAKGLGLAFGGVGGGAGRDMEETELEEGEACSYQNNDDDYDASIDPDVALSYIDVKLQDVLGHFQKDFEGGVSAENLGAKFGGYGSFLPTYQRSPVCSHPRTPQKVQHSNTTRSPKNLQLEGGCNSSAISSTATQSGRIGPASANVMLLPALKAPSISESVKQDVCTRSSGDFAPKYESACKKPVSLADQKTLKVRIKVGSDNLSTRNNAAIYSGLGLDVSPSSSLDESHSESEGLSHEPQDVPYESPTSILRIMTSFPVFGALPLSPLPDYLLHLTENEKLLKDNRSLPAPGGGFESSGVSANGPDCLKGDGKVFGEKKNKVVEKTDFSLASRNGGKDAQNGLDVIVKKGGGTDTLSSEEVVCNTLKLPFLSNSNSPIGEIGRGMVSAFDVSTEAKKVAGEKVFSDVSKEEPLDPIFIKEGGSLEKPEVDSSGKVWEDKSPRRDANHKGEKIYDSVKADSNVSKGSCPLNAELVDPSKKKPNQKSTSHEQEGMKLPPRKDHPSSGGKKKSKGSQSHASLAAEVPKESIKLSSSLVPKNKKGTLADTYTSKSDLKELKLQNGLGNSGDTYKDFFGDINLEVEEEEEEENQAGYLEMPFKDRPKESEANEKSTVAVNNVSKERSNTKKFDKPPTIEGYPKAVSNVAPHFGNRPCSDTAPVPMASVNAEDNWVCCDKCQKWRLLPLGINPDNLPEKWLCIMLDWLPGMNRCSVSEEETTKALIALYQVPAPESQNYLQSNTGGVISALTMPNVQQPLPNNQNLSLHGPSGGKKRYGLKEISNATNKDGPTQLLNSMKKNMQASVKSRSLNDVNHSPQVTPDMQHLSKSSDTAVKKHRHKQKEKQNFIEHYSDGGDMNNLRKKTKRDPDRDYYKDSKKTKTERMQCSDDDWTSDYGGVTGKVGTSSSSGLPSTSTGKDQTRYNDRLFSKEKYDSMNKLQTSNKKPKVKNPASLEDGSQDIGDCDKRDIIAQKRKVKEGQDALIDFDSLQSAGHHLPDRVLVEEETSETDYRNEKKARVSESVEKESNASKGSRTDKEGYSSKNELGKDQGGTVSQRSLDGIGSLKRESVQPSVAATSSSSKVSGSNKTKTSVQEVKGSPVESVSSSPMRILNPDKLALARRNQAEKGDSQDAGVFVAGSPRRCSDGEDDGGCDRSRTERRDKTFSAAHRGSLESSVLDFQDRNFHHLSGSKVNGTIVPSPDVTNHHFINGGADNLGPDTQYPSKPQNLDGWSHEERQNDISYSANGSRPRKSGKGSSSRSKEKNRSIKSNSVKSEVDMGNHKSSGSFNELHYQTPSYELKSKDGTSKLQYSDETDNKYVCKKDSSGKFLNDSSKRESQAVFGGLNDPDVKVETHCSQDAMSTRKQNLSQSRDTGRSSRKVLSDKTDKVDLASGRGKPLPFPPSGGGQSETQSRCPRPTSGNSKGNGVDVVAIDASEGNNTLKVPKQVGKAETQNRAQHTSSRNPASNGHRVRDLDARSPMRKDHCSQAANNAVKEATDLKHLADRLKNTGSNTESTGLYFQAALKFLHGASLLESSNSENGKHGDMIQSMQLYSSTAKLCEFCAHEYEKFKDMANAALAYKCMEVAYMRVVYSSHNNASRDRHELHTALLMVPPGESPSSSASDVDNLNNPLTADKVSLPKGLSSPQVAGNHIIAARNRPNFMRLLNFTQDVNYAMEASRKSRLAFAAANVSLAETQHTEGISSIKRALDFNYQDIEGLLPLVRRAMEAISR